jgi:hypothetical protein
MTVKHGPIVRALSPVVDVLTAAPETDLATLAVLAELDRAIDFRGVDLRGWNLAFQDLRGFDFTRTDLRGTRFEDADIDETTIFERARLDARTRRRLARPDGRTATRGHVAPGTYTKVRIPDLSSAELLERVFVIADPLALDRVVQRPPPTDQWITYEGRYDVATKVRCAFRHPHKRGYVFRDEGGNRYLIGNTCGASHLGMGRWQDFAKQRELLEERASYLRGLKDLQALFARSRNAIAALALDPAVKAFDASRERLHARHPSLLGAVRQAAAFGGQVSLPSLERDFASEEKARGRAVERAERDGRPMPTERPEIMKRVLKPAGVLRGLAVFNATEAIGRPLARTVASVDAFLGSDVLTTKRDLAKTLVNVRPLIDRIGRAVDAIRDHAFFFQPANLALFSNWAQANRFDGCSFEMRGDAIVVIGPDGSTMTLSPPPVASVEFATLDLLRRGGTAGTSRRAGF